MEVLWRSISALILVSLVVQNSLFVSADNPLPLDIGNIGMRISPSGNMEEHDSDFEMQQV
jgi:hypothetical protein